MTSGGLPVHETLPAEIQVNSPQPTATAPGFLRRHGFLCAAIVVLVVIVAFLCDAPIDKAVPPTLDGGVKVTANFVSTWFDWTYIIVYSAVVFGIACCFRSDEWRRLGLALFLSSAIAGLVCTTIRSTTGRTRPNAEVPQGWYGLRHDSKWMIFDHHYNSFPSGHMGTAAGFAGIIIFGRRRWAIPAVLFGACMGWSRIILRCHHFSDVVVAGIIGLATAYFTWHVLVPRFRRFWSGSPRQMQAYGGAS